MQSLYFCLMKDKVFKNAELQASIMAQMKDRTTHEKV